MRTIIGTVLLVTLTLSAQSSAQHHPAPENQAGASPLDATSARFADLQWQPIVPESGADGPQVATLRVDSKTTPPSC